MAVFLCFSACVCVFVLFVFSRFCVFVFPCFCVFVFLCFCICVRLLFVRVFVFVFVAKVTGSWPPTLTTAGWLLRVACGCPAKSAEDGCSLKAAP